jgi:hypothetical protein
MYIATVGMPPGRVGWRKKYSFYALIIAASITDKPITE